MAETLYPLTDVASNWVEQSVQSEIHRGEKLRQLKLRRAREDDAANFSKKPSLARTEYPPKRRRNGVDGMRKRARSNSPQSRPGSRSSRSRSARRARPVCSMRISQLAVPSKRQCIETWRSKANILPEFMVHRLRQQIMDQTPIVQISDAVTCFKYEKTESTKANKRPRRKINKEAMRQREFEENKNLSVLFGNKLLQELMKPKLITLIPRLKNMSSVVTEEISCVMKDRRHRPRVNADINERMIQEISVKVTIWIAEILEGTKEKLLEEDLRVKKMNERIPATVNGEVITLLDATVVKEKELEEEEGPALDALEDIVDNVLSICIPSDTQAFDDGADLSPDYLSVSSGNSDDIDDARMADDCDSFREHLMNELLDIINTIKSNGNLYFDSVEVHPNLEEKNTTPHLLHIDIIDGNEEKSPKTESFESITSQQVDNDKNEALSTADEMVKPEEEKNGNEEQPPKNNFVESITSQEVDIHSNEPLSPFDKIVKPDEESNGNEEQSPKTESESITSQVDKDTHAPLSTADEIVKPDEEKSSNVSDTLEILSEEEKNKKVKFSHDDIGHLKVNSHHSKLSNAELYHHTDKGTGKVASESSLSTLRNVYDSWPSDLPANVVKPSASAIISITSLGRILESEERNLLSIEVEVSSEHLPTNAAVNIEPPDNPNILEGLGEIGKEEPTNLSNDTKNYSNEQTPVDEHMVDKTVLQHDSTDVKIANEYSGNSATEHLKVEKVADEQSEEFVTKPDTKDDTLYVGTNGDGSKQVEFINQGDGEDGVDDAYEALNEIATDIEDKTLEEVPNNTLNSVIKRKENIWLEDTATTNANTSHDDASKQSLVSVMLFEMQMYGEKIKDVAALREYISNIRCECAESDQVTPQSEKPNIQNNPQRSGVTDAAAAMPKKFDYRVHPETAPTWLTCGQGEPGGGGKGFPYSGNNIMESKKPIEEREREILKWCNDLDNILNNLSKWKTWLEYITIYITTLKQKAELKTSGKTDSSKITTMDQLKPPRTIDKDIMQTQIDKRAKCGLKLYRNDETIQFKVINSTLLQRPPSSALPDESVRRLSEAKPSIITSPAIAIAAEILPTTTITSKQRNCRCATKQTKRLRMSRSPTKK